MKIFKKLFRKKEIADKMMTNVEKDLPLVEAEKKETLTNRDLYITITKLIEEQANNSRALKDYLRSLMSLALEHKSSTFSVSEFTKLFSRAFSDEISREVPSLPAANGESESSQVQLAWYSTILRQIADLQEMDELGMLNNDYKYFGLNAPSGQQWYNFDPITFLECAAAGMYGGWQPGDETGRKSLTGKKSQNPVYPIPQISWADFQRFLIYGQRYE